MIFRALCRPAMRGPRLAQLKLCKASAGDARTSRRRGGHERATDPATVVAQYSAGGSPALLLLRSAHLATRNQRALK
jgi:hypothetical protein